MGYVSLHILTHFFNPINPTLATGHHMPNYKEVDYRNIALRAVCTTMTNTISELGFFAKEGMLDGIAAMEYASYMEGAVLVNC